MRSRSRPGAACTNIERYRIPGSAIAERRSIPRLRIHGRMRIAFRASSTLPEFDAQEREWESFRIGCAHYTAVLRGACAVTRRGVSRGRVLLARELRRAE